MGEFLQGVYGPAAPHVRAYVDLLCDKLAAERIASDDRSDQVATVGVVVVPAAAANVIAGRCRFTLDVRAGDAARRDQAAAAILARCEARHDMVPHAMAWQG